MVTRRWSASIRNPLRSVLICAAITLVAFASIAWGVFDMQAAGQETLSSGLKIFEHLHAASQNGP
jgi:hypothetical protein